VLLGPTYGKIQNLTKIAGSAASREWTASDTHTARMAILGSNLPFFPRAFEALEGAVNTASTSPRCRPRSIEPSRALDAAADERVRN
jgi:hypothetical protein